MAGHSKWANIKHRKARQDSKRSKIWSKCSKAIIVAARAGGGDPDANLTLRYAIDEAKAANMPKDTIEKAVAKGSGEVGGEDYEAITYEGYGPNGVAVLIETLTDNKNRTVPEIRKIFEKHGGNLGTTGCVAYVFSSKGEIYVEKAQAEEESLMETALEAGAEDVVDQDEAWQVVCEPSEFMAVKQALADANIEMAESSLTMIPSTTIKCEGNDAQRVLNLVETLEDHDDVQKVHANYEVEESEMAKL